ncbi:hypothetical protein DXG01_002190, partial [Tephrocybe rancida]
MAIMPPTNSNAGKMKQTTIDVTGRPSGQTCITAETNIETAPDNMTSAPNNTHAAPDNTTSAPNNTTIPRAGNRASEPDKSIGKDNTQNGNPGTFGNLGITTQGRKKRHAGDVEGSEMMETGT